MIKYPSQGIVPILSPMTDNLPFLSQRKRETFPTKNVTGGRVILGPLAYEADRLPTELLSTNTSRLT